VIVKANSITLNFFILQRRFIW